MNPSDKDANANRSAAPGRSMSRLRSQSSGRPGRFQRNRLCRARDRSAVAPCAGSLSQLDAITGEGQGRCGAQTQSERRLPTALSMPAMSTFTMGVHDEERDEQSGTDSDSVLSDFDLVNDTIQEFLLASDNSDEDSVFSGDFGNDPCTATVHVAALLPVSGTLGRRLRMAKKSASSSTLSTMTSRRVHSSFSTGSLWGLASEVDTSGEANRRQRRSKKRVVRVRGDAAGVDVLGGAPRHRPRRHQQQPQRSSLLRPLKATHRGLPVGPLSIVLDIDETLVAARQGPIHVRPYVKDFLDHCEKLRCEIIVWTAGAPGHVNPILHAIADVCGRRTWFHHIISRHRRWYKADGETEAGGVKDLQLLGRPLDRVLIVENNPVSVSRQPGNAILVEDYLHPDERDDTLHVLADVVRRIVAAMARDDATRSHVADESATGQHRSRHRSSHLAEPMMAAAVSVAEVLLCDSALRWAEFDLDIPNTNDEEAEGQLRRAPGSARSQERVHSPFGYEENEEEDEKALLCDCDESGPHPGSSDGGITGGTASRQRVQCWILQHSPGSLPVEARSYGCLNPVAS